MRKSSPLKLGIAVLVAASTLLAARSAQADLCVYQYQLPNGQVCTFTGYVNGCCHYSSSTSVAACPPICAG
jgi:hypothetical protein